MGTIMEMAKEKETGNINPKEAFRPLFYLFSARIDKIINEEIVFLRKKNCLH
jgi:hypothetical protein